MRSKQSPSLMLMYTHQDKFCLFMFILRALNISLCTFFKRKYFLLQMPYANSEFPYCTSRVFILEQKLALLRKQKSKFSTVGYGAVILYQATTDATQGGTPSPKDQSAFCESNQKATHCILFTLPQITSLPPFKLTLKKNPVKACQILSCPRCFTLVILLLLDQWPSA